MNKKFLTLNDISAYKIAFELSQYVWTIVIKWDHFAKDTIGKQFVRAVDSNSANIAEGFSRFFKKEKIQFYRYSFGSVGESRDWNEKSKARNLVTLKQYEHILSQINRLPIEINNLIRFTNSKLKL